MYVREIEGKETTFGVSGALWRDALIFYDRESGSYWSQIDGRSVNGKYKGKQLEELPSIQTTWGQWKKMHPDTMVLKPDKRSRGGSPYAGYNKSETMGVLGTKNPDDRLPGKTLVLGVEGDGSFLAIPLGLLEEKRILNVDLDEHPVLLVSAPGGDGYAYRPVHGEARLHFKEEDGVLMDTESGSRWDPATGKAISGKLSGSMLPRLETRKIYWFVWASFHPETGLIQP